MDADHWPWRITVTRTDGTTRTTDYTHNEDFDAVNFARHMSAQPNVTRVDVSTSFVAGEQVTPGTTTEV